MSCWLSICIRADANTDPTKLSYSDQARFIANERRQRNMKTECWQMVGNNFFVMQGRVVQATLHNELLSNILSRSLFKKYNNNRSGDFGISFDGTETILSVPWQDLINYSHIVMFFCKSFDQSCPWGSVFKLKTNPEYAPHVFFWFASEYFGDTRASSQLFAAYKDCLCSVYQANAESYLIFERFQTSTTKYRRPF
jgi:hypothetical protein